MHVSAHGDHTDGECYVVSLSTLVTLYEQSAATNFHSVI